MKINLKRKRFSMAVLTVVFMSLQSICAQNKFFAMDNALKDVKSIPSQAKLLKELGYDGVSWRPGNTAGAVQEMSGKGLKVYAFMMKISVTKGKESKLPVDEIKALHGTGAIIWVQVLRRGGTDADIARELKRLNALAKPMGLPIAIYPHIGNGVDTLEDAMECASLVNDANVGVSLTLCHQLKAKGVQDLKPLLKKAMPQLKLVQISGAESGDTKSMGWDKLIQPLGSGGYDVKKLLKALNELNYRGPVGVIGYGIKQPAAKHLKQSMDFWQSQWVTVKSENAVNVEKVDKEKKVVVNLDGKLFTEYRYGNPSKPILYPIIGPHGIAMTRHYPMKHGVAGEAKDHPHHQSLYYAHIINGVDFWHARKDVRIKTNKILKAEVDGDHALIVAENAWMKGEKIICTDTTTIRAGVTEGGRFIDFGITIHASQGDITFVETKEGTMAIRTHPALRLKGEVAKGSAVNSEGVTGKDVWGKAAKWVDYYGSIDSKTVGIAIFDHPKNPRHPTTWHARDYGLITANPFGKKYFKAGQGALDVKKGDSVSFVYRFYFHEGDHKQARISERFDAWSKESK